jgi:hypothetical protein
MLPRLKSCLYAWFGLFGLAWAAPSLAAATPVETLAEFTDRHCSSCHNDVDREGGLDLTALAFAPDNPDNFLTWVKVHDRVQTGEMPPKDKKRPEPAAVKIFLTGLSASLVAAEQKMVIAEGRTTQRRLNRSEYENAVRDLLHAPWVQVQDQLPEDGEAHRFNKVSTALDVSHVHMARYIAAADYALRQVMSVEFTRPATTVKRFYAREDPGLSEFRPRVGNGVPERLKFPVLDGRAQPEVRAGRLPLTVGAADPETREREAMGWTSSNYATGFSSRWLSFRAPVAGRYRVSFKGYTIWVGGGGSFTRFANGQDRVGQPMRPRWYTPNNDDVQPGRRYEPITVYSQGGPSNRRLGEFDIHPESSVQTLDEIWLVGNEYLVTDSRRFFRSRPGNWTNPLVQRDGMPGVAFQWMEVEGPLYDASTRAGYRLLFGDLPLTSVAANEPGVVIEAIKPAADGSRGRGGQAAPAQHVARVEVVSLDPKADAARLIRGFVAQAYRRPATEKDLQRFIGLTYQRLDQGLGFAGAMLAGYTAVLASPGFIFLPETPGALDDYALATRLALFLWNSAPDAALRARADRGELQDAAVLQAETARLLADARSQRFVNAFLDYWIDIRKMEETSPSTTLYNDYNLDESLTEAALAETRLYFTDLVAGNRPARNIVDSDFTYLNDRLATHYGIEGVTGAAMRRVALPAGSVRGGLMTQASVLKVTANGTTTSPVLRGKWIMERIVGYEIPPPPAAVPAVEPDIRGAVTIRQQLDKHRADESCAGCHRKIDPPGFALENFDVMGGWRERYRADAILEQPVLGFGKNGLVFTFSLAQPVDSSGEFMGHSFSGPDDFKALLLRDEAQIARNLARQLAVYATGAPVRFSDRPKIDTIIEATRSSGYGIRKLIEELILSDLFRRK